MSMQFFVVRYSGSDQIVDRRGVRLAEVFGVDAVVPGDAANRHICRKSRCRPAHAPLLSCDYLVTREEQPMTRKILLIVWIFLLADFAIADDKSDELFKAIDARDLAKVEAMLSADPSLANARRKMSSATEAALFLNEKGFFVVQSDDSVLKAILARKPQLDLFEIAALGDSTELQRRLDADRSAVHARNQFGWTALHMAAFAGNVANAKLLLDRGADVNERAATKFCNTPLLISMLTGRYEVAKLLLDRGADVLARQSLGFAAMHEAALLGRTDLIQLLLDRGAELNSRSDDGRSPLSEAMRGNHPAAIEFLKSKGATSEISPAKLNSSPD